MKRKDIIVIFVLLFFSLSWLTYSYFIREKAEQYDKKLIVKSSGREIFSLPFDDKTSHTYLYFGEEAEGKSVSGKATAEEWSGVLNGIVIDNGEVLMAEAACPDKVCVHTGKISRPGQIIVCLPHKLTVEIAESDSSSPEDSEHRLDN